MYYNRTQQQQQQTSRNTKHCENNTHTHTHISYRIHNTHTHTEEIHNTTHQTLHTQLQITTKYSNSSTKVVTGRLVLARVISLHIAACYRSLIHVYILLIMIINIIINLSVRCSRVQDNDTFMPICTRDMYLMRVLGWHSRQCRHCCHG